MSGQLAKVETLYESNFRDVPATLRKIAEEIESGAYGAVPSAALVLLCARSDNLGSPEVFGLGEGGFWATLGHLQAGIAKAQSMIDTNSP